MRNFLAGILTASVGALLLGAVIWIVVLPRLDWGASHDPSAIEQALTRSVLVRWIQRHAHTSASPLMPTSENLKAAQTEYKEHCAACHGLDGSGRNQFEADFYPPVMKLTGSVQKLSDSELYFIVAHGIRNTAMPAFGKAHSPDDMWRTVLWVRHVANLTPAEKAAIERQMKGVMEEHEKTMVHGMGQHEQQ
jgi:mono/diheme cytochrome c family protein